MATCKLVHTNQRIWPQLYSWSLYQIWMPLKLREVVDMFENPRLFKTHPSWSICGYSIHLEILFISTGDTLEKKTAKQQQQQQLN